MELLVLISCNIECGDSTNYCKRKRANNSDQIKKGLWKCVAERVYYRMTHPTQNKKRIEHYMQNRQSFTNIEILN